MDSTPRKLDSRVRLFVYRHVFWLVLFAWAGLGAAQGPTRSGK